MPPLNQKAVFNWPNAISVGALLLSLLGIALLLNNYFYFSFGVILGATALDFLDGYLARRLNQESEFGRRLDGCADVFIYLIYPALVFYLVFSLDDVISLLAIFLFTAAGVFRLWRFSREGYIINGSGRKAYPGLPVVFSLLLLLIILLAQGLNLSYFIIIADGLILLTAWLMVKKFPFPKPAAIAPFIFFLLALALLMFYLGQYAAYQLPK